MKKNVLRLISLFLVLIVLASFASCGRRRTRNNTNSKFLDSASDGILEAGFIFQKTNEQGVIKILTNLPEKTTVTLLLRKKGFNQTAKAEVVKVDNKNYIITEPFTDNGKELKNGNYNIKITMDMPSLQAGSVKEIIGDKGQNLKGTCVYEKDGEVFAMESIQLHLKKGIFYKK